MWSRSPYPRNSRYGTPGASLAKERRKIVASYRSTPITSRLASLSLVTLVIAAIAYSITGELRTTLTAAAITLLVGVLVNFALAHTGIAATFLVLIAYTLTTARLAGTYTVTATNNPDASINGYISAILLGLLVAVLAHRTSRGRPWVTVLLSVTAATSVGLLGLLIAPRLGFLWAIITAGAVLFLRAGGWLWLVDQWESTLDRVIPSRSLTSSLGVSDVFQSKEEAVKRTAATLSLLPEGWVCLHDVAVPRMGSPRRKNTSAPVEHILIGPGGVFVVGSLQSAGNVTDDAAEGVMIGGRAMTPTLLRLSRSRDSVASAMRLLSGDVAACFVVHDVNVPEERMRIGLFTADDMSLGEVSVTSPEGLLQEVAERPSIWTPTQVRRLVRKARAVLPPATASGVKLSDLSGNSTGYTVHVNQDGHIVPPVAAPANYRTLPPPKVDTEKTRNRDSNEDEDRSNRVEEPRPLILTSDVQVKVTVGQSVSLLTDEGVFHGIRVVSEPYDENGVAMVLVSKDAEWQEARVEGGTVKGYPFPLASVNPA